MKKPYEPSAKPIEGNAIAIIPAGSTQITGGRSPEDWDGKLLQLPCEGGGSARPDHPSPSPSISPTTSRSQQVPGREIGARSLCPEGFLFGLIVLVRRRPDCSANPYQTRNFHAG